METAPTSPGRALLARAFTHWCVLHWGFREEEIAEALAGADAIEPGIRERVEGAARLLGELLAAGDVRSWARPLGGGLPVPIAADAWELDDFRPRFATSALNLQRPFDATAAATHWIFLDLDDFNSLVEASCADAAPRGAGAKPQRDPGGMLDARTAPPSPGEVASAGRDLASAERLIRMPEVIRRTALSRSTVYDRIKAGRFPHPVADEGNVTSWLERDVNAWVGGRRTGWS